MIEMIIVVAITATIFVMASDFLLLSMRTEDYADEQNQAIVESRRALGVIVNELRETSPADTGAYPLASVEPFEIIFYSDIDKDETTERVRYSLEGYDLVRGITEPSGDPLAYNTTSEVTSVLSTYVRNSENPVFIYYNEDYPADLTTNPLSSPIDIGDVRMVQIDLEVNVDPIRLPETNELSVSIHLRNLKENFKL